MKFENRLVDLEILEIDIGVTVTYDPTENLTRFSHQDAKKGIREAHFLYVKLTINRCLFHANKSILMKVITKAKRNDLPCILTKYF